MGRNLSTEEVAAKVNLPASTLRYYRHIGTGPASFKLGKSVRYDEDVVDAWVDSAKAEAS